MARDTKDAEAIDPRIAARRDAVTQEKRRRRSRIWIAVAIVVGVLALGWYLTRTGLLDVDDIEVRGTNITTAQEITDASGIRLGMPLLEVDTSAAAGRIRDLPWVATAIVDRGWDGHVLITITERVQLAVVRNEAGEPMLVDGDGRVLDVDGPWDGVDTLIEGVVAGEPGTIVEDAGSALEVARLLGAGVRSRVSSIVTMPDGNLELHLRPQGVVLLGPPTELEAKLASLQIVMGQVDQRDLAIINVVNPETPVVVRTPK